MQGFRCRCKSISMLQRTSRRFELNKTRCKDADANPFQSLQRLRTFQL